jgi:hypothetical protein
MNKTIDGLREVLFDTLKDLRDKEKPMDLDRAKAVVAVAQTIVDSARTEVEFIKVAGGQGTGFIPQQLPPAADGSQREPAVRVHKLR